MFTKEYFLMVSAVKAVWKQLKMVKDRGGGDQIHYFQKDRPREEDLQIK